MCCIWLGLESSPAQVLVNTGYWNAVLSQFGIGPLGRELRANYDLLAMASFRIKFDAVYAYISPSGRW